MVGLGSNIHLLLLITIFSTIISLSVAFFPQEFLTPISTTNEKCKHDSFIFIQNLQNSTLWAARMFDSSAKLPVGILSGNVYQFGNFDECLEIGYEKDPAPIKAQYCLIQLIISPTNETYPEFYNEDIKHAFDEKYHPYHSLWEQFRAANKDPSKAKRDVVHWATCLPASCTIEDIKKHLHAAIEPIQNKLGINLNVSVEEKYCQSKMHEPYSILEIFTLTLLVLFISIIIICTGYDLIIFRNRSHNIVSLSEEVMLSFSAYSNLKKLNQKEPSSDLGFLHGLKVLSMVFIILGHRFLFTLGGPLYNAETVEELSRKLYYVFYLNGAIIVDTFFTISGFLTAFFILLEINKKNLNLFLLYFYRWARLIPPYAFMVLFYSTLIDKFDSGPLWKVKIGLEKERCLNNWWTNLLFINNYVNADNACMLQSWYITCDFHYFLVASIILILLHKRFKIGLLALVMILLLTIISPFTDIFINKYYGVLRTYMKFLEDPQSKEEYFSVYIKSHIRAGPYFIGITAGYIYHLIKARNMKIPKMVMIASLFVTTCVALASLFGSYVFIIPNRNYDALENAFYGSLHRWGWAVSMATLFIIAATRGYGVFQAIVTSHVYIPLSRLTYCAFLTHMWVQLYTVSTLRQPEYVSLLKLHWMTAADVVFSFILALFLHLTFEAPFGRLQKLLLRKRISERRSVKENIEDRQTVAPKIDNGLNFIESLHKSSSRCAENVPPFRSRA